MAIRTDGGPPEQIGNPEALADQREQENVDFYRELYGIRAYRYDAVSGAQIKVQIGELVLIEDATAVQFTLTQSKKPIYGYHSQLFDAVAPGVVIVHGRIWMNFIHQGYLRTLIDAYHQGVGVLQDLTIEPTARRAQQGVPETNEEIIEFIKRTNLESQERLTQLTPEERIVQRPDDKRSVDIHIHYGDIVEFGPAIPRKVIYNCHFLGEGQDNQISGQPIQEWYEFIAQRVT